MGRIFERLDVLGGITGGISGALGGGGDSGDTTTINNVGVDGKDVINGMNAQLAQSNLLTGAIVASGEATQRNLINAGVKTNQATLNAATEAARIQAGVAKNQADKTAAVMTNRDNNDTREAIARIDADTEQRKLEGAERLGMRAIDADERTALAKMNAQQQAHATSEMANGFKYMAALNQESAMTSQENMLKLADASANRQQFATSESLARVSGISTKAIDEMSDLASQNNKDLHAMTKLVLEANSVNNRINAEARDRQAEAAIDAQLQLTGALLGPGGVQGLLGQQGNLFSDQTQQFNRMIYETQKFAAAEKERQEESSRAAGTEAEALRKELRMMEMEKIKRESETALKALERLTTSQAKNPELLKRPASESVMSMVSESIVKSTQNCKGQSKNTMKVSFGGTGNVVSGNTLVQENTFSASCMQDVSVVSSVQTQIASTISETMSIVSRTVADSIGLDPTQMDRKIQEDVKNAFTSETLQEILNEANNSMEIEFKGTDNQIKDNIVKQVNNSVFSSTQKVLANLSIMQMIDKATTSVTDSDSTVVSDESKNAANVEIANAIADVGKAQAYASVLDNGIAVNFGIGIFLLVIVLVIVAIFASKKKSQGQGYPPQQPGYPQDPYYNLDNAQKQFAGDGKPPQKKQEQYQSSRGSSWFSFDRLINLFN